MRVELEVQGVPVHFVAINKGDAVEQQQKMVDLCSFPLLQDLETIGVWDLMAGHKDDFYVYDAEGKLARYLPIAGPINMNLSDDDGYENLKTAILEVAGAQPPAGCVTATPKKVNFGGAIVTKTKTLPTTLASSCTVPVTVKTLAFETDEEGACVGQGCDRFQVQDAALPATLAPGETLEISLTYAPTEESPTGEDGVPVSDEATLIVSSDGADLSVAVSGLGVFQPCAAPTVAMTSGDGTPLNTNGASVSIGAAIALHGTENPGDGPASQWEWSVLGPEGSTATLKPGSDVQSPTFTPDVAGLYTVSLDAYDPAGVKSCVPGKASFSAE